MRRRRQCGGPWTQSAASDARMERLVGDLEDRLSEEWARTDPSDVDAMKRWTAKFTDETVQRIVNEAERVRGEQARRWLAIWAYL